MVYSQNYNISNNTKENSDVKAIIPAYNEPQNIEKKRLSALALVAAMMILVLTVDTTNPIQAQETEVSPIQAPEMGAKNEVFAVVVTLYGVDNTTGNVVTFVNTNNNVTRGAVLNATEIDLKDGSNDGILDVVLAFQNATITTGEEFRACNMVLKDLSLVCDTGYNSPSPRAEYSALSLANLQ
jgi:hypothetical protein